MKTPPERGQISSNIPTTGQGFGPGGMLDPSLLVVLESIWKKRKSGTATKRVKPKAVKDVGPTRWEDRCCRKGSMIGY